MSIQEELRQQSQNEQISPWVYQTVRALSERFSAETEEVLGLLAACLHAREQGNICVYLDDLSSQDDLRSITKSLELDYLSQLQALHGQSQILGSPGDFKPLIFEDNRLYLHKYWCYEQELTAYLKERIHQPVKPISAETASHIDKLYTATEAEDDHQKMAVQLAIMRDLVIISGGPGTGKTHTVRNIIEVFKEEMKAPRIALCAPTGKAAQRLTEAIRDPEMKASTIHHLLRALPDGTFGYHQKRKLPYDLIIVDEASMLDIRLWVQLIRALDDETKLIVLGDKDQLASVEAGSVLGDMCSDTDNTFSAELAEMLNAPVSGSNGSLLNDSVVILTKSYRFEETSGLKLLADAINEGDAERAMELLLDDVHTDISFAETGSESIHRLIREFGMEAFEAYREAEAEEQFKIFNRHRILCALRKGELGVEKINAAVERSVLRNIKTGRQQDWYPGKPILFTRNDSFLNVKNGETGIYNEDGKVVVEGDNLRAIPASRLQNFELSYAITVHKSQGSEYEKVALLLPERINPILTRELLYTAVTRARSNLLVIGRQTTTKEAIRKSIRRSSGLAIKLRG